MMNCIKNIHMLMLFGNLTGCNCLESGYNIFSGHVKNGHGGFTLYPQQRQTAVRSRGAICHLSTSESQAFAISFILTFYNIPLLATLKRASSRYRQSILFSACLWGSLRWAVAEFRFKMNWGGGKKNMHKLWPKSYKDVFWHLSKDWEKWAWQDHWNQMKK